MPTLSELMADSERRLLEAGVENARRDVAVLASLATGRERAFLIAHPEYEPSVNEKAKLREMIFRRAAREPLQHIRGTQEFYGLDFEVTPDVLIPRPETEVLVERAIELLSGAEAPRFLDIGVGSGCISVSILHNVPGAAAIAVDVSPAAIAVAARNAAANGVAGRIEFVESDVFGGVPPGRFDLIVSNPPYVHPDDVEGLQPEVRGHEPWIALTDGSDGLSIVRRIIAEAPEHLLPGGHLLVEIGFGQADDVLAMVSPVVWGSARMLPDLQGIPRVLAAKLR